MISKLICHGRNREEAIQRMIRSLDEFVIEGITSTIDLHKKPQASRPPRNVSLMR